MKLLEIAKACVSGECHKDCKYLSLVGGSGGCGGCCQVKLLKDVTRLLSRQNIKEEDSEPAIPYSIKDYLKLITPSQIELKPIDRVYKHYNKYCANNNLIPEGKIIFGRWVCRSFNMEIKNKNVNAVSARRYILKKEA